MPPIDLDKRNEQFLDANASVTDKRFSSPNKSGPVRGDECEIILRKANRRPIQGVRESLLDLSPESGIGVNTHPLATQVRYRSFSRPTHASHLHVAVVRGQENSKSLVMEQTEKIPQETLPGPLPNLVVHPRRPQLHAVHDPVHFVNDESDDT